MYGTRKSKEEVAMNLYTSSGKWIDVKNPENNKPEDFDSNDMCKIARLARYGGLTNTFYSVGAHSWVMQSILSCAVKIDDGSKASEDISDMALLHDVTEVYYADMPYPVKVLFPEYEDLEKRAFLQICRKFSIDYDLLSYIKPLDKCMWDLERPILQDGVPFEAAYSKWFNGSLKAALEAMGLVMGPNDLHMLHDSIEDALTGGIGVIKKYENLIRSRLDLMAWRRSAIELPHYLR